MAIGKKATEYGDLVAAVDEMTVEANKDVFSQNIKALYSGVFRVVLSTDTACKAMARYKRDANAPELKRYYYEDTDLTPDSWYEFGFRVNKGGYINLSFSSAAKVSVFVYFDKEV
ncbi:MAG: hypothetical protein ACXQTS_01895 [Candidatus Methanospirareceae archaeon]